MKREVFDKVPVEKELPEPKQDVVVFNELEMFASVHWYDKQSKGWIRFGGGLPQYNVTHFLKPVSLHCFTDAELKERDRAIAGDVKHVFEHGDNCKNYHTACDNCLHEYYEWYKLKDQGSAMRLKRS